MATPASKRGAPAPLKIVFLIYSLGPGGAERVTATLANAMAERGHEVTIVLQTSSIATAYHLHPGLNVVLLRPRKTGGGAVSGAVNLIRDVAALRALLVRLRPDLAIGMMNTAAILLGLARTGLRGRFIGSERIYPPAVRLPSLWSALRGWAYGQLDCVVVQSEKTAEWARRHTRTRRVRVIGNPVVMLPLGQSLPSPDGVLPCGTRLALAVGRLVPQKRLEHAISAFAPLAARQSDWHLAILGQGECREALQRHVDELDLSARVTLVGPVRDLGDWFERAEIFVLTSEFEGMPNAMMEAMIHDCVPIAYDIDTGPAELVVDGVNGWLVGPGLVGAMSERLIITAEDHALRRSMQLAARAAMTAYCLPNIAQQWLALASGDLDCPGQPS